jgi:nitroimidazol reductase NimA-like FMN-containing flavoprotein (pyridoxamine 5'-phosphate oxidase superfamily)
VKTTLEIPDDLFRRTKSVAALRGESLKEFVTEALEAHLEQQAGGASSPRGWRSVFGQARPEEVESVDAVIAEELERVEPDEWR